MILLNFRKLVYDQRDWRTDRIHKQARLCWKVVKRDTLNRHGMKFEDFHR